MLDHIYLKTKINNLLKINQSSDYVDSLKLPKNDSTLRQLHIVHIVTKREAIETITERIESFDKTLNTATTLTNLLSKRRKITDYFPQNAVYDEIDVNSDSDDIRPLSYQSILDRLSNDFDLEYKQLKTEIMENIHSDKLDNQMLYHDLKNLAQKYNINDLKHQLTPYSTIYDLTRKLKSNNNQISQNLLNYVSSMYSQDDVVCLKSDISDNIDISDIPKIVEPANNLTTLTQFI